MAGLKKPSRRKETTSPNVVLVIFLVFFVLLSIGLGVFAYYGYAGQERADKLAKDAGVKEKAAAKGQAYYRVMFDTLAAATGAPVLSEDEKKGWAADFEEFSKEDGSKFKDEPTFGEYRKGLLELKQKLG